MNPKKKEIRRILCGQYNDDGVIIRASERYLKSDRKQMNSAVWKLRLLGMTSVRRRIEVRSKHPSDVCADVMSNIGRVVELASAPEDVCVLRESYVRYPYLVTAGLEKNTLSLRLYSPRSFFSLFRGINTLKKIEKCISEYKK